MAEVTIFVDRNEIMSARARYSFEVDSIPREWVHWSPAERFEWVIAQGADCYDYETLDYCVDTAPVGVQGVEIMGVDSE